MEDINDYILLKIFKKLDWKSILNCSKVCTRWHDLILSSPKFTDPVTLVFDLSAWEDNPEPDDENLRNFVNEMQEFPYKNFKLYSNFTLNSIEPKIIKTFYENFEIIEKLCIRSLSGNLMNVLLEIAAPNLTHLTILSTYPDEELSGLIELPKVEYLKLAEMDSVMKILKCDNVTHLDIERCKDVEAFKIFMKNSNDLRKLKKFKTTKMFWELEDMENLQFRLEELELSNHRSADGTKFVNFTIRQANSVKYLTINENIVKEVVVDYILSFYENLKYLKIRGKISGSLENGIQALPRHEKLETLEIQLLTDRPEELNQPVVIERLLRKCGNIKNLTYSGIMSKIDRYEADAKIPLPHLKNLTLDSFKRIKFFEYFDMQNVENLRVINVESDEIMTKCILKTLSKLPRLKHLQVHDWTFCEDENNLMESEKIDKFFHYLRRLESFKIEKCDFIPTEFFKDVLAKLRPRRLKLLGFSALKDDEGFNKLHEDFKDEKYLTYFKKFSDKSDDGPWEDDVENFLVDDSEKYFDEKARKGFILNLNKLFYPDNYNCIVRE